MNKSLKLKLNLTLDQKEQDKRDAVIEQIERQGLPAHLADSFIYRVGLDSAFRETQTQNEHKPTNP